MSPFFALDVSAEVIRAACDGDAKAHEHIFRACRGPVYTLIRRLIPRAAVADDVFQDTFVELLRNIRAYSGEGSFGGWVRSIAVSKCLMYLRSPWHRNLLSLDAEEEVGRVEPSRAPDAQIDAHSDLVQALAQLPALSRSVVWLHDVEGYTHAEIARMLGRTASFSKSQLARAHLRLRQSLEAHQHQASSTEPKGFEPSSMQRVSDDEDVPGSAQLDPIRD
jgi:RNA polymerase sigma factor (sigma-70 family)